jgi:hypothetical protein
MFYLCGEIKLEQGLSQLGEPGQAADFLFMSIHFSLHANAVVCGAFGQDYLRRKRRMDIYYGSAACRHRSMFFVRFLYRCIRAY